MDAQLQLLKELSEHMDLEPAEDTGCPKIQNPDADKKINKAGTIYNAALAGGKRIALLKTLLTSACERNCYYCPFRAGRDFRRATLKPEQLARAFTSLHHIGVAEGLFLSSGITGGGIKTQDALIDTAEILRSKYNYTGYLHLKIMPGAERDQILRAMQLSDRVSINLEAPNTHRLQLLAPRKGFINELLQPLKWAEEIRQSQPSHRGWNGRWPSLATQFVVGAVGETDYEMLKTTDYLYRQLKLKRAYYSAFKPISNTPLENQPAESPLREQRLYQASFLLRDYGFRLDEFLLDNTGNLPLLVDPKTAWANNHLSNQPIEINKADAKELIRLPGIGPVSLSALFKARRDGKIKCVEDLRRIGINPVRLIPYILIDGKRPAQQLPLLKLPDLFI